MYDVTDPYNNPRINATTSKQQGTFTTNWTDTSTGTHTYIALTKNRFLKPLSITPDKPSNLHSLTNGADYIIITHADFQSAIQPLADFARRKILPSTGKFRVKVVDVQDVYDEFSGGVFDAQAIHDFLAYAYANWQPPKPSYVLLVGDGNLNLRNYPLSHQPNFIPPYMKLVDPSARDDGERSPPRHARPKLTSAEHGNWTLARPFRRRRDGDGDQDFKL